MKIIAKSPKPMPTELAIRKLRDAHRQVQEVALHGSTGYDISLREVRQILSGVIHGLMQDEDERES